MSKIFENLRDLLFWLPTFAVAILLIFGARFIDQLNFESYNDNERIEVMKDLSILKAQLEGKLNNNLQTVEGLVAAISVEPNMQQARFAEFARPLFSKRTQLRNLGAAPNMILSMIYPLAGNEKALGLNYLKTPEQRDAALQVKETGRPVVAGPVQLVQGGVGFVGRIPVFISVGDSREPHFWGLLSAVIDAHELYRVSGLLENSLNVRVAIRGKDGRGATGAPFFGDEQIFTQQPETAVVPLPGGQWLMAAIPQNGWAKVAPNATRLRLTLFFISVFILTALIAINLGQQKRLHQQHIMRSLFDLSPIGIALNDYKTGAFIRVNMALAKPSGYSQEEFVHLDYSVVDLPDLRDGKFDLLEKIKSKVRYGPVELNFLRKDGSHYPALFSAMVIASKAGEEYIWSIIQDLSEQKAAQQAVEASQRELKNFFDLSLVLMCITTASGRFEKINSAFTRVLGYSSTDILSTPFIEFVHPDDHRATRAAFAGLMQGESLASFTNRYRCIDGSYKSLMWNTVPDPHGGRFYAVAVDISQQIANEQEISRAHDALSTQMEMLEAIAATQSCAITQQDSGKLFDELLAHLLRLTGSAGGLVGEIIYPDDGEPFLRPQAITNVAWNDAVRPLDPEFTAVATANLTPLFDCAVAHLKPLIVNSPQADYRYSEVTIGDAALHSLLAIPIVRDGGGIALVALANRPGGFHDELAKWLEPMMMTIGQLVENLRMKNERERVQDELLQAINVAEHAARAKSEFLAVMSHEIRTPMNGVLGMLTLLLDSPLNESQTRKLAVAKDSADSLLDIINDILDFSKIDSGQLTLEEIDTDLPELLGNLAESFALRAQQKNLELLLDMVDVEQRFIKTDPGRLRQILSNLLGNAIKFTERGEITLRCRLLGSDQGTELHVSIRDTGIGIPADKIDMLFTPFTQVDASTTRKYGGTGLGLAICKQLCNQMGGEISVSSCADSGSEFTFFIPVVACETAKAMPPDINASSISVLVIDNNQHNAQLIGRQLAAWEVRQVQQLSQQSDLIAALQSKEQSIFAEVNLILIDEQNYQLIRESTTLFSVWIQATKNKVVILMTAMANLEKQAQNQKNHIFAAVPKPIIYKDYCVAFNGVGSLLSFRSVAPDSEGEKHFTQPIPKGTRVLLVEDNRINQEVASLILEDYQVQMDIANDGVEALSMLNAAADSGVVYSAILMDCQMPHMDGYEATTMIRKGTVGELYRTIPIIAITANALKGDDAKCLAAGMNDYLSKPVNEQALIEKLSKWCRVGGRAEPGAKSP